MDRFHGMSVKRVFPLLCALLGGVAIGWMVKPDGGAAVDGNAAAPVVVMKREARRDEDVDGKTASRWLERMQGNTRVMTEHLKMREVAEEVPAGDYAAVLAGFMESVWGSFSYEQQTQFNLMLEAWVTKDKEGALAWARGLLNPQQREAALQGIAGAVAHRNPQEGYSLYCELDQVTMTEETYSPLRTAITSLYDQAVAQGPQALLDLLERAPGSKVSGAGLATKYPQGFDFATLLDGLALTGITGDPTLKRPYFQPASPLLAWTKRDPEAAFAYVAEHLGQGTRHDVGGMTGALEEQMGGPDRATEWITGKLLSLEPGQRQTLLAETMISANTTVLDSYLKAMPSQAVADEFIYDAVQGGAMIEIGWAGLDILDRLPDVEQRLAVLERVRGAKHFGYLESLLEEWKVPEERIKALMGTVKQPRE